MSGCGGRGAKARMIELTRRTRWKMEGFLVGVLAVRIGSSVQRFWMSLKDEHEN